MATIDPEVLKVGRKVGSGRAGFLFVFHISRYTCATSWDKRLSYDSGANIGGSNPNGCHPDIEWSCVMRMFWLVAHGAWDCTKG
jgi:hypothetical protein